MATKFSGFPGRMGISLIAFSIFLCLGVSYGEVQFVLSRNKGTWKAALDSCKSIRGSLAILDNIELQQGFDKDVKPSSGESVWVGRYVGYSPIVTIDGCYRNQTLEVVRSTTLVNNYLVSCLQECTDTQYIGMQGQLCFCVNRITPQATVVPGVYCRSTCPGEKPGTSGVPVSWCGRTEQTYNTVSVYRKLNMNEVVIDTNVPNQGECIAYNARAGTWQPLDCNQPKLFTCDRLQCNAPPSLCVMESTLLATWFQARERCEGANSLLATVNRTNTDYFKQKVILGDPFYWTGLHRKEAVVWSYDTTPDLIERSDRCFVAKKQPNGGWQVVMEWCNNQHRYVCMQEFTPKTTVPQTSPPIIRTTTRPRVTTRFTRRVSTSTGLPTVDPFATPLSVQSSATRTLLWLHNIAAAVIFQTLSLRLIIRFSTI